MPTFKIPTRFKLLGQTINVVFDASQFVEKDGYHGFASYRLNEIQLKPGLKKDLTESAFFHELMHFILYHAEAALPKDSEYPHKEDGFVEMCGALLHQALTTMEYDDTGKAEDHPVCPVCHIPKTIIFGPAGMDYKCDMCEAKKMAGTGGSDNPFLKAKDAR